MSIEVIMEREKEDLRYYRKKGENPSLKEEHWEVLIKKIEKNNQLTKISMAKELASIGLSNEAIERLLNIKIRIKRAKNKG